MIEKHISRRQALKIILAAGGGLSAASFLPEKWLKPVVGTGVLPVHAATSITYYVKGFYATDPTGHGYPACIAAVSSTPFVTSMGDNSPLCLYDTSASGTASSPNPVAGVNVTLWKTDPTLTEFSTKTTNAFGLTDIWYFDDYYQGRDIIFKLPDGTEVTLCIPS